MDAKLLLSLWIAKYEGRAAWLDWFTVAAMLSKLVDETKDEREHGRALCDYFGGDR